MVTRTKLPIADVWEVMTDISSYPSYVKFMKKAKLYGPVAVGTWWHDITTILWVPLSVKHKIVKYTKLKTIAFDVFSPFGSRMYQTISLQEKDNEVEVVVEISFKLSKFFDIFLGSLLEKRLKDMIIYTFDKMSNKAIKN